jgi:hypothetical protein
MTLKTIDFISSDAIASDKNLFFGPVLATDTFVTFDKTSFTLADMAIAAKLFKPKNEAHRNGWPKNQKIPLGFGMKKANRNRIPDGIIAWFNSMDNRSN